MIQSDTFDHSPLPVGFRPKRGKAMKSEWDKKDKVVILRDLNLYNIYIFLKKFKI